MYHHSVKSLNNLFIKNSMNLFYIEKVNIQKGSIIGFATKRVIRSKIKLNKFLLNEKIKKIYDKTSLKKFYNDIQKNKMKCHKILSSYGLNGKIGVFGAAKNGSNIGSKLWN